MSYGQHKRKNRVPVVLGRLILDHMVERLHRGPWQMMLTDGSLWCLMCMLLSMSGMGTHEVGSVCCCRTALLGTCTMHIICCV